MDIVLILSLLKIPLALLVAWRLTVALREVLYRITVFLGPKPSIPLIHSNPPVVDCFGDIVKTGDILSFHRDVSYSHFAIAVDPWNAVHLTGISKRRNRLNSPTGQTYAHVREDSILSIANNDRFFVTNHIWTRSENTIEDVVQTARSLVGQTRPYNLITSNCEHFVNELVVGQASSRQVQVGWAPVVRIAIIVLLAVVTTVSVKFSDPTKEWINFIAGLLLVLCIEWKMHTFPRAFYY